jgi:hypothetical protein
MSEIAQEDGQMEAQQDKGWSSGAQGIARRPLRSALQPQSRVGTSASRRMGNGGALLDKLFVIVGTSRAQMSQTR